MGKLNFRFHLLTDTESVQLVEKGAVTACHFYVLASIMLETFN